MGIRLSILGRLLLLFIFVAAMGASQVQAENGWQYWKEGKVTKEPWTEGQFTKIEIDQIPYTFMPATRIYRITRMRHGGFNEKQISPHHVYQSQQVNMLVQGFRIYQLKVKP